MKQKIRVRLNSKEEKIKILQSKTKGPKITGKCSCGCEKGKGE